MRSSNNPPRNVVVHPAGNPDLQNVRQLPHALDSEESVLGAVLLDPGAIARVANIIQPEAFFLSQHQEIYRAAMTLHQADQPVTLTTVTTWLIDRGLLERIGGRSKLIALLDGVVSSANVDAYALLIRDRWIRRNYIAAGQEISEAAYNPDSSLEELQEASEQRVYTVSRLAPEEFASEPQSIAEIAADFYDEAGTQTVIPTGLYDLDRLLWGGLAPAKVTAIIGRTSSGKSQLGVFLANSFAEQGFPGLYISPEMTKKDLMERFVARLSGINSGLVGRHRRSGGTLYPELTERIQFAAGLAANLPFWIDDKVEPTIAYIRSKIRNLTPLVESWQAEFSPGDVDGRIRWIIIDYFQLLGGAGAGDNRVKELDHLVKGLCAIAKDFNLHVVLLAQARNDVDERSNKAPQMGDAAECRSLANHVNHFITIYRPDYYLECPPDKEGKVQISLMKNREGQTGSFWLWFTPEDRGTSTFRSIA